MKKRIAALLTLAAVLALLAVPAAAVVDKSSSFYVADYADVLSSSTEQTIISTNGNLEYYCKGAQIVVVTVQYLDGLTSDEYAGQLFNSWGVGSSTENNGILLLLATGENKAWLTTGSGITGSLTDSKVDSYLNKYFWDDFDAGKYDEAVTSLFNALVKWYDSYYGTNVSGASSGSSSGSSSDGYYNNGYDGYYYSDGANTVSTVFIVLAIVLVFALINDRRRYRSYYMYMGMPMPPYHFWYLWGGPHHHWDWRGPGGPGGFGGGPRGPGGWGGGGFGGGGFGGGSGFGGGGHSGGGFGGGGHMGGGFGGGGHFGGGGGRR